METNSENKSLEDFSGWPGEPTSDVDFFAEVEEEEIEEDTKPKVKEEEEETPSTTTKTKKKKEEEEEPEDFFAQASEEEEDEEEEEAAVEINNISTLNYLKEKNIVDFELEEGEELTEELAEEIIEESIEERANEKLKSLPQKAQDIIKFALKGGDVEDYLKVVGRSVNSKITKDLDIEDEANQELVLRQSLEASGEDEETIEAQIDFYKDAGKLKSIAEKKYNKWLSDNEKSEEELVKKFEEQKKAEKLAVQKAKETYAEFISENPEVNGLKFTREDKKTLPSYVAERTVKLSNGTYITQMQKELFNDIPQNKEAYMQLATLMKNRNKDGTFNFKSIMKDTQTKVVKKVREDVRRSKTNIPDKSAGSKRTSKTTRLADLFN